MVAGYLPFDEPSLSTLFRRIQTANYTCPTYSSLSSFSLSSWFSENLKDLLSKILVPEPTARLSLDEVGFFISLSINSFQKGLYDIFI